MRWIWALLSIAAGGAVAVGLVSRWPAVSDVRTGGTPEYPDLQPRRYDRPRERVWDAALATARSRRGWEITANDPATGEIHAVADVFLTPFKDDVTVQVTAAGGESVVNVRSRSRVGRADLGVNARRIRAYLRALDERLAGARKTE
jgi:uncharacterized protein (DUF1499 family)